MCDSEDGPGAMITWRKIDDNNGFGPSVQQRGNNLSIINAQPIDSGTYECTAEWNRKIARSKTYIIVQCEYFN